jgi:hypothetical protein
MKKYSFLVLLWFGFTSFFAQSALDTVIREKSKDIKFSETQDHFMINITMDNVINGKTDTGFKSSWFNPNVGFYFMYDLPIGNTGFSFAPGLGFTFSKVNLDGSILRADSAGTYFENAARSNYFGANSRFTRYEGSSFYTSWIEAPIEIRWRSKPLNGRNRLKVAVGARVGIRMASNSKIDYIDPVLGEQTNKQNPFRGINGLRYGATFRIGYGAVNLFGYYGMSQLIKDSENTRGHDLRQYSIGISITGL